MHCLVPGGALSEQGQWNPATSTYLFPVRALSRHVRGGFVSRLRQAINDGRLKRIKGAAQIDAMLDALRIRHFGFLANRCRRQRLEQIRTAIKAKAAEIIERTCIEETPDRPCPKCRRGRLRVVGEIAPRAWAGANPGG